MPFSKLGLSPKALDGVRAAGHTDPTPIQLRGIPIVMAGGDLIGSAQTGTGKTAAFALPIISRLGQHGSLRALILEPTRELAAQVETAIHVMAASPICARRFFSAARVTAGRTRRCVKARISWRLRRAACSIK